MACSRCEFVQKPRSRGLIRGVFRGFGWVLLTLFYAIGRVVCGVVVGVTAGIKTMFARSPQQIAPTPLPMARPLPVARIVPVQTLKKEPPARTPLMDKPSNPHKQGTGKRIAWLLVIGGICAAIISMATSKSERYVSPPPVPEPLAKSSPRRLVDRVSDAGIVGGAQAGRTELATKFGTSSPQYISVTATAENQAEAARTKGSIRLTKIRSDAPHLDPNKAQMDALLVAQQRLSQALRTMNPPIETLPSVEVIRTEYVKPNSFTTIQPTEEDKRLWTEKRLEPNRVWSEIETLEVSAEQLRALRSTERLELTGWWGIVALVVIAAIFGFLKVDSWTRGYLTMILGLGFAAAGGGAVALLFWMR